MRASKVKPKWAVYGVNCDNKLSSNDMHSALLWRHLPLELHSWLIWLKTQMLTMRSQRKIPRSPSLTRSYHTSRILFRDWKMYAEHLFRILPSYLTKVFCVLYCFTYPLPQSTWISISYHLLGWMWSNHLLIWPLSPNLGSFTGHRICTTYLSHILW